MPVSARRVRGLPGHFQRERLGAMIPGVMIGLLVPRDEDRNHGGRRDDERPGQRERREWRAMLLLVTWTAVASASRYFLPPSAVGRETVTVLTVFVFLALVLSALLHSGQGVAGESVAPTTL